MNKDNFKGADDQFAGDVAVGAASKAASTGDISDQVSKLTQTVSDLVQKQASTARDQVMGAVGVATDTISQTAAATQDKLVSMEEDIGARIRKNPWSALAIAALIGLLIGKM